jgi:hypothetical protein
MCALPAKADKEGVSMRIAFTSRGPARASDDSNVTVQASQRRSFLRLLGSGLLGATGVAGLGGLARAEASEFEPLWNSAQVLIGNSPTDQNPSPVVQCPLFFDNGHFAHASHTLDLSNLPRVSGTITVGKDTIEPDFSSSVAAAATLGTDGISYLVVAGEGKVTSGRGYFSGVTNSIVRCKYKVADPTSLLLIACVDCVVILVRN